ncbi:hypothetical protein KBC75_06135 [Candidatus Shapirobacteria bacterium]|nr:hypothetical protein [Candidatus Shapirobacteria bacterium]
MEENKKNSYLVPGLVVAGVVVAGVIGFAARYNRTEEKKEMVVEPTSAPTAVVLDYKYKDGEYSAEGMYTSPAGPEQIKVDLTVKDGVVTDSTVTAEATVPKSVFMQGVFVDNYKPMVVGKNLNEIKLDKVAGSSLTPKGFNDALDKIREQAKV